MGLALSSWDLMGSDGDIDGIHTWYDSLLVLLMGLLDVVLVGTEGVSAIALRWDGTT